MSWQRLVLAGVGGQGVLSMGRWIGEAAHQRRLPVVVQQTHGLSQRGGSVTSSVVIGGACSPEVPDGMADLLVALEPMEGVRVLQKVSQRTTALLNTRAIVPGSLQSAGRPYPPLTSLLGPLQEVVGTLTALDATTLAEQAGSARAVNVVMLGMLAGTGLLPFAGELLLEVILASGLPVYAEVNQQAFRAGQEAMRDDSERSCPGPAATPGR